jgi:menaquinone-specific isochorismate synthase
MTDSSVLAPEAASRRAFDLCVDAVQHAGALSAPRLARVEVPVGELEPLPWLLAQHAAARYFWSDRGGAFEMAGIGDADVLLPSGPQDVHGLFQQARSLMTDRWPSQRYYGGFRFYNRPILGNRWKSFAQYRFIVPRLEVHRRRKGTYLAVNLKLGAAMDNARELESLRALLDEVEWRNASAPPLPEVSSRVDLPDFAGWKTLIAQALSAFARHELEKVVVARESTFNTKQDIDPVALLAHLREQAVNAYEYCFQPVSARAFVGASPERLYRRENCFLQSEALAGTRPRGKTEDGDEALARELLESEKDLREHDFVVRMLHDSLKHFCTSIEVEEAPSLLRLRNCQHLHTRIEGVLKANEADAPLIEALHPTPAVGGTPREAALAWLIDHEPFDRGTFAAPVGWIGYDAAEFAVAIRSGLVRGNELSLYSGAGIVPGSVAEDEWDEIENKLANFLRILPHADH